MAPQPLYDFLPCRWPDASRSTSHLPSPYVTLLVFHDPKSITGILAVPPASDVGIPFVEDDPKIFRPGVASLRTAAKVDRDYLAWFDEAPSDQPLVSIGDIKPRSHACGRDGRTRRAS